MSAQSAAGAVFDGRCGLLTVGGIAATSISTTCGVLGVGVAGEHTGAVGGARLPSGRAAR